jgi:5-deoxy-D-glucuronate isomerase
MPTDVLLISGYPSKLHDGSALPELSIYENCYGFRFD